MLGLRTIAHFKIIDTNVFTCSSLIFECIVIKIKTYEFEQNPMLKKRFFSLGPFLGPKG